MKTLRFLLPLLVILPTLRAAAPRFYVTGQIGAFAADAGTVEGAGYYPAQFAVDWLSSGGQNSIKSGTQTFRDFSVGAELNRWFALEAGYAHFNAFSSPRMRREPPGIQTAAPVSIFRLDHRLRVYRVTPVVRFSLAKHLKLALFGGLTHSASKIITRKFEPYGPPSFRDSEFRRTTHSQDSYHLGAGLDWSLTSRAAIEARFVHYDFGKVHGIPRTVLRGPSIPPSEYRITAMTYSLGLSWHF